MEPTCREIDLDRYLDDELPRSRRSRIERHMQSCPGCRERLAAMRQQALLLREKIESAADLADFADFEDRVLARIRREEPAPWAERTAVWLREVLFHFRAVWITSLVTALLLLAVLVPLLSRQGGSSQPELLVDNRVIIDRLEYAGQRSMIFKVSKNNTTVIWLYDFDTTVQDQGEGDDL